MSGNPHCEYMLNGSNMGLLVSQWSHDRNIWKRSSRWDFNVTKKETLCVHQPHALQAMANDSDLNIENNIRKRDTQFISKFWLKTLENQMKYILPCILLEHTGGINLCFYMKHDLKHRKKGHNVFVRYFGTNNGNIILQIYQIRQFL